jgi:hypothetical protein
MTGGSSADGADHEGEQRCHRQQRSQYLALVLGNDKSVLDDMVVA